MAKKKRKARAKSVTKTSSSPKSSRASAARGRRPAAVEETRAAEASTVAWMLSAVATLFGALAGGGLWLALQSSGDAVGEAAGRLPFVLLFSAQVSGLVALALTPVVHVARKQKPPKLITCLVLLVVAAPWVLAMTLPVPGR